MSIPILRVHDEITGTIVEAPRDEIGTAIMDLYPHATPEMVDAVKRLQYALDHNEYTGGWESYLAIRIERI